MNKTIDEHFDAFLQGLQKNELALLKEYISLGKAHGSILTRMSELENPTMVCPVCESAVSESSDLVLHFGQPGLRQKARFCGHDCLEFFLMNRRKPGAGKDLNSEQDSAPYKE